MALFWRKGNNGHHEADAPKKSVDAGTINDFREAAEKSGRAEADIRTEASDIEREYGITAGQYLAKEYYMLPKERMLKKANSARLRDLYVHKVSEECSWTVEEARAAIKAAAEKYGITYSTYYKQGYFRYIGEEQVRFHEERMQKKKQATEEKVDWVAALSEKAGLSEEEATKKLASVNEEFGILPKLYVNNRYYELPVAAMLGRYLKDRRTEAAHTEMYHIMEDLSGKNRKQVREEIRKIREQYPDSGFSLTRYFRAGSYMLDPDRDREKMGALMEMVSRRTELEQSLKEDLLRIDYGELRYEDISDKLEEYRTLIEKTLSEGRKRQIVFKTGDFLNDFNDEERDRLLIDIELTGRLLGFFPSEYVAFGFNNKGIPERRTYVSSQERWQVIKLLNTEEGKELLDSKYDTYLRVKSLYKRNATLLEAADGYEKFLEYAKTHEVFVKKNNYDSLGRGVEKIDLRDGIPLRTVYEEMTADSKQVVLEDLISPAPEIKALNPDSVNTMRVIVFRNDDGEFLIQDTFAKIGRKGSFIDNGGAGGILVHIDPKTGAFDSYGIDEACNIYETHPDHGYRFIGIEMPHWNNALNTAIEASRMVPEARYIGWDLTYTESGDWIIVEGNSKTQFFAQQMTRGRGIKKEFYDAVNYNELMTKAADDDEADEADL